MGDKSKIAWTDATWNPAKGCTPISEGCAHCYAARMADRLRAMGQQGYKDGFAPRFQPQTLYRPMQWRRARKVFTCSMGDLFHEDIEFSDIRKVFDVIGEFDPEKDPRHIFQILTKRPQRALEFLSWYEQDTWSVSPQPWPNIWWGVTAENQVRANERIPLLLQIPAVVRFVSVEPMLESVDLRRWLGRMGVGWVICGCESGPGARPMDLDWVRDLQSQCGCFEVPFFFKQAMVDGNRISMPALDGRVWAQFPEVRR
jgi:protein gp37